MKKNDLILIIGTALFSFLFYKQGAGLNFFLFSLIMPVLLGIYKPELVKNKLWLLGVGITGLTGFSVFLNSTTLSVFGFYFAISYLAGVSISLNSSPFAAISYATFSYLSSPGFVIADAVIRRRTGEEKRKRKIKWGAVITMGVFIFIVVAMFFFLYQSANPLFKEITKFINLDFISFEWIMFTLLGFLLVYGFMYTRYIKKWDFFETVSNTQTNREKIEASKNRFLWFSLDEKIELQSGVVLFALLNFMILAINVLDISFVWTGMKLPEGFTYAEYLHKGIFTLIFSCVMAILLILLMFRGKLNFIEKNKSLKILAYAWIIQNIFMALSCALRNGIYISTYALTYRRIIIFMLLALLVIGLITAFIKILRTKNIYYLFRSNSFAILIVFIAVSLFNWDAVITKFNLKNSEHPDIDYLVDMNSAGLPHLLQYIESNPAGERINPSLKSRTFFTYSSFYWQRPLLTDIIYSKTYDLLAKNRETSWKSFSISEGGTINKIRRLYESGTLKNFEINNKSDFDISLITEFKGLKGLSIHNSQPNNSAWIEQLSAFNKLQKLSLTDMRIEDIDKLSVFPELENLNLSNNDILHMGHLVNYPGLKQVDISMNPVESIGFLAQLQNVESLNISFTQVRDLSTLEKMENLKKLEIRSLPEADFSTLPICPALEEIDLSYNNNLSMHGNLAILISNAPNLQRVTLRSTGLQSLTYFSDSIVLFNNIVIPGHSNIDKAVLQHITHLDVSENSLSHLKGIENFPGLKVLHATNNEIINISHISKCTSITELDLSSNSNLNLNGIENLSSLKYLHLSYSYISDISPLTKLKNLEALTLSTFYGEETNLSQLKELKKLRYLAIQQDFSSLDFISELPSLEYLDISGYIGSDLHHLHTCQSLKVLIMPSSSSSKEIRRVAREIPQVRILTNLSEEEKKFYRSKYGVYSY